MSWYNQPLNQTIAQYIYNGASRRGLDPNYVLGIATHEGLNRNDPLASNVDYSRSGVYGVSTGPFQDRTGGLGTELGITSSTPWQTQVDKNIDYMAAHPNLIPVKWSSVRDQGGIASITAKGAADAQRLGIDTSGSGGVFAPDGTPTLADYQAALPNQSAADTSQDWQQDTGGGAPSSGAGGGDPSGALKSSPSLPGPLGDMFKKALGPISPLAEQLGGVLGGQGGLCGGGRRCGPSSGIPVLLTDVGVAGGSKGGAGPEIQTGLQDAGTKVKDTGAALDTTLNKDTSQITQEGSALGNFLGVLTARPEGLLVRTAVIVLGVGAIAFGLWQTGSGAIKRGV